MRTAMWGAAALAAALSSPAFAAQPASARGAQDRAACVNAAAAYYKVPPALVYAIMRTEGGTTGRVSRNTNGSVDMGLMQINSIHLKSPPHALESRGITREMLINDECLNIHIGTYIISYELSRPGDFWYNVGAYNSRNPKRPEINEAYRTKVWNNLIKNLQGR